MAYPSVGWKITPRRLASAPTTLPSFIFFEANACYLLAQSLWMSLVWWLALSVGGLLLVGSGGWFHWKREPSCPPACPPETELLPLPVQAAYTRLCPRTRRYQRRKMLVPNKNVASCSSSLVSFEPIVNSHKLFATEVRWVAKRKVSPENFCIFSLLNCLALYQIVNQRRQQ